MTETRRFDASYREEIELADGTQVVLRLVRPGDGELLRRGFDDLSPESRAKRFLTRKAALSDAEVEYLTNVDQEHHFALGAVETREGREHGLGIARFIRSPDSDVAEPAVTIVDSAQQKGLGTALLTRLGAAALERGVRRFSCLVLADNPEMLDLLRLLDPDARSTLDGPGVLELHLALAPGPIELGREASPSGEREAAAQVLSLAARADVEVLPRRHRDD